MYPGTGRGRAMHSDNGFSRYLGSFNKVLIIKASQLIVQSPKAKHTFPVKHEGFAASEFVLQL